MNWNGAPGYLNQKVHWLWVIVHAVHENITIWVFTLFVAVGLVQIGLAIEAGYLAIRSLPPDVETQHRQRHLRVFVFGGGALLLFTVLIGLLNLKSQIDSDRITRNATEAQTRAEARLVALLSKIDDMRRVIDQLKGSLTPGQLSTAQKQQLAAAEEALEKAIREARASVPPNAVPSVQSQSVPPLSAPAPNYPAQRTFSDKQRSQFRAAALDAQKIIDTLKTQDEQAQAALTGPHGILGRLLESGNARDSDPIPDSVRGEVQQLIYHHPDYSGTNVQQVTQAFSFCCMDEQGGRVMGKFQTFQNGDMFSPQPPRTIGDLRSAKVQQTSNAQALLGYMKNQLLNAAGQPSR